MNKTLLGLDKVGQTVYTFDKILQCFPVSPIFTLFTEFALSSLNNFHSHNIFYPICHRLTQSDIQREQIGLGTTFAGGGGRLFTMFTVHRTIVHTLQQIMIFRMVLCQKRLTGQEVMSVQKESREVFLVPGHNN